MAGLGMARLFRSLFHDPDPFMAEDRAGHHTGDGPPDEMQVGAADRARRESDDGVGRFLNHGIGDVIQADVSDAVEDDGFDGEAFAGGAGGPHRAL